MFGSRSFGSPSATVALHWGSRSTSSVRQPASATQAARLTAVVVFPTPPFWFATAYTVAIARGPKIHGARGRSQPHAAARSHRSWFGAEPSIPPCLEPRSDCSGPNLPLRRPAMWFGTEPLRQPQRALAGGPGAAGELRRAWPHLLGRGGGCGPGCRDTGRTRSTPAGSQPERLRRAPARRLLFGGSRSPFQAISAAAHAPAAGPRTRRASARGATARASTAS